MTQQLHLRNRVLDRHRAHRERLGAHQLLFVDFLVALGLGEVLGRGRERAVLQALFQLCAVLANLALQFFQAPVYCLKHILGGFLGADYAALYRYRYLAYVAVVFFQRQSGLRLDLAAEVPVHLIELSLSSTFSLTLKFFPLIVIRIICIS